MKNSAQHAVMLCCAVTLAAAQPAAALVVTPSTDAFDLAQALAPAPGLASVTGDFVEVGAAPAMGGAIGTFSGGTAALGISSGVVMSTGNIADLFEGSPSTANTDLGWTPSPTLAAMLDSVPGEGGPFFDAVRFSLTVTPEFSANFLNFRIAYGTNEVALATDRLGIFVNGVYTGVVGGADLNQNHPWAGPVGSGFGLGTVIYPSGDLNSVSSFFVSLPIDQPGTATTVDFVLADSVDGNTDTGLFLGDFSATESALGFTAIPEPGTVGMFALAAFGLALWKHCSARRRNRTV